MFDEYHRMSVLNQCVERLHQLADVMEVEACGGFIKDEKHFFGALLLAEVECQFHPLALTAGEG